MSRCNALADALEWILRDHGVEHLLYYLDDFITCGLAGSDECLLNLNLLTDICKHLGVPLAEEKMEGLATSILFLGILNDSVRGELRLPSMLQWRCGVLKIWAGQVVHSRCDNEAVVAVINKCTVEKAI